MRCRRGLRDTAALVAVLLPLLRHRDINLPVVGRVHIVTGKEDLGVEDVRVIVQVATLDIRCTLRKGLGCLRESKQTECRHLVDLVRRVVCGVEHLSLVRTRAGLCCRCIAELCAARSVLNQLKILVVCLDRDVMCISAVAVTVCVKLRIEPDAGQRLHNDRIRRIAGLKF